MAESSKSRDTSETRVGVVVDIDPAASRRGLDSRLQSEVHGVPVLRRTIERLNHADLDPPIVCCPKVDAERVRSIIGDLPHRFVEHDEPDVPSRAALRRARQWGKDGWRGGLLDAYAFCEGGNPRALSAVAATESLDHVAIVPAEAALVDPRLVAQIVEHARLARPALALSTAPPGLAADVIHTEFLRHLAELQVSIDQIYPFRPGDPGADPDVHRIAYVFDERITCTRARLLADSARGLELVRALAGGASATDDPDALTIVERLSSEPELLAGKQPEEIVIELTSDAGAARRAKRNPDGEESDSPLFIEESVWSRIIEHAASVDDALVTLGGGYSDPLGDPRLLDRLEELRAAGAFGLHVETSGARLDRETCDRLVAVGVDAITVDLGAANSEATRRRFPNTPDHDLRRRGLDTLIEARGDAHFPLIVAAVAFESMSRGDIEALVDTYHGRASRVLVRAHVDGSGRMADGAVASFAPPRRFPCVHASTSLRIERDGVCPQCPFDARAEHAIGQIDAETAIRDVWQGERARSLRSLHGERRWGEHALCRDCSGWFAWT